MDLSEATKSQRMHARRVLLFLAVATLVPFVATGQAPDGSTPAPAAIDVLSDVRGDVHAALQGQSPAIPDARFKALDLVAASAQETRDELLFTIQLSSLADNEVPIAEDGMYTLHFRYQDVDYAVVVDRYVSTDVYLYGQLTRTEPGSQQISYVGYVAAVEDTAAGTITATVRRDDVTDLNGASPFPGRSLQAFWAETHIPYRGGNFINIGVTSVSFPVDVTDRMPDSATGATPLPIRLGIAQQGHALMTSPDPMRASNGEATTFVFTVHAKNLGGNEELFEMTPTGAPANWAVTVPDQYLRLKGGEAKDIPVLVSVPFYHVHGDVKRFILEMRSTTDSATIGRVALGIRYYAIPQPAGHHPQVWFHSQGYGDVTSPTYQVVSKALAGNAGYAYMNAQQDDASDQKLGITGEYWGYYCDQGCQATDPPRAMWHWYVFLSPSLEMGLDFDLTKEGTLSVPIMSQLALPKAQLDANLWHYSIDEKTGRFNETLVARMAPADAFDFSPGATQIFSFPVKPRKAADYLAYNKNAALVLELNLTSIRPSIFDGPEAPILVPGGTMTLPLIEYHDQIGDAFGAATPVRLQAMGDLNRAVNPGRTAIFQATLVNGLDRAGKFDVSLEGVNKQWTEVLTPGPVDLASGKSTSLTIAVHVPADVKALDATDFVLSAQDVTDPTQRAMLHFVAHVDGSRDIPDDAPTIDSLRSEPPAKHSPAAMPFALAVVLLGAALLRRRR